MPAPSREAPDRDEQKRQRLAYRDRARDLYERASVSHDPHYVHESIDVPLHAHVQVCEDGAFVEATVWVPKEKLERPRPEEWHTVNGVDLALNPSYCEICAPQNMRIERRRCEEHLK